MASVTSTEARVLFSPEAEEDRFLPEGPRDVTVDGRAALAWVNIQTGPDSKKGAIHLRFWDNGERREVPQPSRPGFFLPTDRPNVVFVGREKELGALDLLTGAWEQYATIPDDGPRTIVNDGEVVPGGEAVVFGTKDVNFSDPVAHLFLLDLRDRRIRTLAAQQTCSNGKVFARDANGLLLFDIDTPRRCVARYRLDMEKRSVTLEGVAVDLTSVDGFPDGMVDGGDGSAIIAFYNPGEVTIGRAARYDLRGGKLLEEWKVPGSPRVTCPLLVERDGGPKLVLTTAVEGMPGEQRRNCPNAGALFIAEAHVGSVPAAEVLRL